jgi:hypothetical protein
VTMNEIGARGLDDGRFGSSSPALPVRANPACRKTLRAETTSWFGGLKSPPRTYIKL